MSERIQFLFVIKSRKRFHTTNSVEQTHKVQRIVDYQKEISWQMVDGRSHGKYTTDFINRISECRTYRTKCWCSAVVDSYCAFCLNECDRALSGTWNVLFVCEIRWLSTGMHEKNRNRSHLLWKWGVHKSQTTKTYKLQISVQRFSQFLFVFGTAHVHWTSSKNVENLFSKNFYSAFSECRWINSLWNATKSFSHSEIHILGLHFSLQWNATQ